MTSAVELYEAWASSTDEKAPARLFAETIEHLQERLPHLRSLATATDVRGAEGRTAVKIENVRAELRETELRLQKEIEAVRAELKADIEAVRGDLRQTELRLLKEIEIVRAEVKTESRNTMKSVAGMLGFQTLVVVGAIVGALSMML